MIRKTKPRRGRPLVENPKRYVVAFRLTETQWDVLVREAGRKSPNLYVRALVLKRLDC
jgi:hypothetical protein